MKAKDLIGLDDILIAAPIEATAHEVVVELPRDGSASALANQGIAREDLLVALSVWRDFEYGS